MEHIRTILKRVLDRLYRQMESGTQPVTDTACPVWSHEFFTREVEGDPYQAEWMPHDPYEAEWQWPIPFCVLHQEEDECTEH